MTNKTLENDSKIKALLAKVEEKRAALGKKPKAVNETNCIFKWADGKHFNINTITDPNVFLDAMAFLLQRQGARVAAAARLGLDESVLNEAHKYNGYTVDEWQHDFKQRLDIVNYDVRKKELTALEGKLKKLISESTRTEMELEELSKLLG